jgi:Dna[CI] antecedent DciA-like protein
LCSAKNYATKTLCVTTTFVEFWDADPPRKMRKPIAISELLAQGKAKLERLKTGAEAASRTLAAVQRALPPELAAHVWGASLSADGALTVVADSGSWASRVRYVMPELSAAVEAALDRPVARTIVRVRPRAAPGGTAS